MLSASATSKAAVDDVPHPTFQSSRSRPSTDSDDSDHSNDDDNNSNGEDKGGNEEDGDGEEDNSGGAFSSSSSSSSSSDEDEELSEPAYQLYRAPPPPPLWKHKPTILLRFVIRETNPPPSDPANKPLPTLTLSKPYLTNHLYPTSPHPPYYPLRLLASLALTTNYIPLGTTTSLPADRLVDVYDLASLQLLDSDWDVERVLDSAVKIPAFLLRARKNNLPARSVFVPRERNKPVDGYTWTDSEWASREGSRSLIGRVQRSGEGLFGGVGPEREWWEVRRLGVERRRSVRLARGAGPGEGAGDVERDGSGEFVL